MPISIPFPVKRQASARGLLLTSIRSNPSMPKEEGLWHLVLGPRSYLPFLRARSPPS
jgi:hypothetical protein